MRIFIDEAGVFLPPTSSPSSYSLVLALVVPHSCEKELFYEFLRLRDSWPNQQIEIKGSSLDEAEVAQVIDLLATFDVVIDFVAADMAFHTNDIVDDFKSRQAAAITAHITREHQPQMVFELVQLERRLREMPNQLFVQSELTIKLILDVAQVATLYYVQRKPEELGDIAWVIDRKGRALTDMEETWSTLILPLSENHFMKNPIIFLKEADYSHFASRYETDTTTDAKMGKHLKWLAQVYGKPELERKGSVIDARLLLREQLQFEDSLNSLGLQLADIMASTLRRALNGNLQKSAWKNIGRLIVHDPNPGWLSQLGPEATQPSQFPQTVVGVWNELKTSAKPMLLDVSPKPRQ